jgi:thiosulfate/3-mercaptopyruvate sulfurtransferase
MVRRLVFALLALSIALLSACAAPLTPRQTLDTPEAYARPEVLVDTAWVKANLTNPSVRLIDVSTKPEVFAEGHIPGASYINSRKDLTNPEDPTEGQILTKSALSALFSSHGITADTTLVLYDDSDNLNAARSYWALKYYQHADVRIYNGGSKAWKAAGEAFSTDAASFAPSTYVANNPDPAIRTDWEYVVSKLNDPNAAFCDTRTLGEYIGVDVRADRGGHLPGAVHIEWKQAVNGDGTFKNAAELRQLYTGAGFTPDKEIITYCQTGVRSAHTWFVLVELLGYPSVRNYDGSWIEYGSNPNSPIE